MRLNPLIVLCRTKDYEEAIQLIESSKLLPRPSHLLTNNSENEVLIEGRSDSLAPRILL